MDKGASPDGDRATSPADLSPASGSSRSGIPSALVSFSEKAAEILRLVERLEELHACASEGEWFPVHAAFAPSWDGEKFVFNPIEGRKFYAVGVGDPTGDWAVTAFQGDGPKGAANAAFISAAKCAMPALLLAARGMSELAQRIEARSDETPQEVRPGGREPDGEADAPENPDNPGAINV